MQSGFRFAVWGCHWPALPRGGSPGPCLPEPTDESSEILLEDAVDCAGRNKGWIPRLALNSGRSHNGHIHHFHFALVAAPRH